MIVLDEQISDENLRHEFRWYPGRVVFLKELRPGSVIKDDMVPVLLSRAREATFITINANHFWGRVLASRRYCVICFHLVAEKVSALPGLTRGIFALPNFRNKSNRMGKVVLVKSAEIRYYAVGSRRTFHLTWSKHRFGGSHER